jgi:peptidoglycan-associated lipoprotein
MTRRIAVATSIGLALAVTACHKNPPADPGVKPVTSSEAPPPPAPAPTSMSNSGNGGNTGTPTDPTGAFNARVRSMAERIHFDYNEATVRTDDNARLDAKSALLKQFATLRIRITGHADERGSDEYNIALGKRRAEAAKDYLVRGGIDASRIETASLGREVPVDPGHDEAAWAQNRRDEFDIIAGTQSLRVP